jgi:hypothetical protein
MIRRRGDSFQVVVYAAIDPLTGRKLHLRESTNDEAEAQRILRRLTAQVDQQRHAKTNATFQTATDAWLRTHEVEETTRASYEEYARVHLYPAFGDVPVGKVSARQLEEFYADLRRCVARCDGRPAMTARATRAGSHIGTRACAQGSASTPTCTRCVTTPRPNCSPRAWT